MVRCSSTIITCSYQSWEVHSMWYVYHQIMNNEMSIINHETIVRHSTTIMTCPSSIMMHSSTIMSVCVLVCVCLSVCVHERDIPQLVKQAPRDCKNESKKGQPPPQNYLSGSRLHKLVHWGKIQNEVLVSYSSCKISVINHETKGINHEILITNHVISVNNHETSITNHETSVINHEKHNFVHRG